MNNRMVCMHCSGLIKLGRREYKSEYLRLEKKKWDGTKNEQRNREANNLSKYSIALLYYISFLYIAISWIIKFFHSPKNVTRLQKILQFFLESNNFERYITAFSYNVFLQ